MHLPTGASAARQDDVHGVKPDELDFDTMMGDDEASKLDDLLMITSEPIFVEEGTSDGAGMTASSTKTTSESATSASASSAYTSPSLQQFYGESPASSVKESGNSVKPSAAGSHSSETIAQMLEYMRACNGSLDQRPPSSSSMARDELSQSRDMDIGEGGRLSDRGSRRIASARKQRSPIQKVKRSLSQGGDGRSGAKGRTATSVAQHPRQRSRTTVGLSSEAQGALLRIDTHGAVESTGPSGTVNIKSRAGHRQQPPYTTPVGGDGEMWATPKSPASLRPLGAAWQMDNHSSPALIGMDKRTPDHENLSLVDFLKRPEGEQPDELQRPCTAFF